MFKFSKWFILISTNASLDLKKVVIFAHFNVTIYIEFELLMYVVK
jgi:hypothetical protein